MSTNYDLSYVAQSTNNTCWAASTAMLVGKATDTEVVDEMMAAFPGSTWNDGATQPELSQVAQHYGFSQIYPVCQGPLGWEQWLVDNGPMLIQVPGNAYHSIVVTGIDADASDPEGQLAQVHVLDPWNGDLWLPFAEFEQRYELAGAGWENNVYRR